MTTSRDLSNRSMEPQSTQLSVQTPTIDESLLEAPQMGQVAAAAAALLLKGAAGCGSEDEPEDDLSWLNPVFKTVRDASWHETAVRKVLHVFAFGSFSTDAQIKAWADMSPARAIAEMITFAPFNTRLSPDDAKAAIPSPPAGTLEGMAASWSSSKASNPVAQKNRKRYLKGTYNSPAATFILGAARTGANPVRQRVGLFETNYHLAVNQNAGVNNWQIFRYYDLIMDALARDLPYEEVLALASQSAAVATQYNHRSNQFKDARFSGNEDFAREFHQLFFGILGVAEPSYHEITTIKNTAKALTDMSIKYVSEGKSKRLVDAVTFGTEYHYPGALDILHKQISGKTAKAKLSALAKIAAVHTESMKNLPLIIIGGLADDNLDATKKKVLRDAWAAMKPRSLLAFLRSYAISTMFHDAKRVKYWTSAERLITSTNRLTLDRDTVYRAYFNPSSVITAEGMSIFRPTRNVFGNQTGLDARGSGEVFRLAYNLSVSSYWFHGRYVATDSNKKVIWEQKWGKTIPAGADDTYRLKAVAEWLWQRFVADGLKNFGPLERAHVYALLGAGKDFASFVDANKPLAVYSSNDITKRAELKTLVKDMEIARLDLGSKDDTKRSTANARVGLAVNFILATPYAFAQEGK